MLKRPSLMLVPPTSRRSPRRPPAQASVLPLFGESVPARSLGPGREEVVPPRCSAGSTGWRAARTYLCAPCTSLVRVVGRSSIAPAYRRRPAGSITYMCGVFVAPYILPTVPLGSSSTAVGAAPRLVVSSLACAGLTYPCSPGAEEITVSQTTPWPVASFWRACILPVP